MENIVVSMYDEKLEAIPQNGNISPVSGSLSKRRDPAQPDKEFGKIDSSLLGLLWPSEVLDSKNKKLTDTVGKIIESNVEDYGVYRYQGDSYTGRQKYLELDLSKAGYWPVLNFWMAITLEELNKRDEAEKYYEKVLNSVDKYIPEQIFEKEGQSSTTPLAWSHAMFIIASQKLGYL